MTSLASHQQIEASLAQSRWGADERHFIRYTRTMNSLDFQKITETYYEPLKGFIQKRIACPADAEDLVQTTFLQIHRKRHQFNPALSFRGWLYRIAENQIKNYLRSQSNTENLSLDVVAECLYQTDELINDMERCQLQLFKLLAQPMSDLPKKQREVVQLRLYHGYKFCEIGKITCSSESAAKTSYSLAIKKVSAQIAA